MYFPHIVDMPIYVMKLQHIPSHNWC